MNQMITLTGIFCLLVAGFVVGDSVSSTIVCDGASWVSSSVIGQGQAYAANLFTTDFAAIFRTLQTDNDGEVRTMTNARSSGPLGTDEYSSSESGKVNNPEDCLFTVPDNITPADNEIRYMGLLGTGQYVSTRELKPGNYAVTMVNGSGIMLVRAQSRDENQTITHSSDTAGNLNMTEKISFGERDEL